VSNLLLKFDRVSLHFEDLINKNILAAAQDLASTFQNNRPFPFLVVENFFADGLLEEVRSEFEMLEFGDWRVHDGKNEFKFLSAPEKQLGPATQIYFSLLHSGRFIRFLETVTGIPGLICDPLLKSGGMHKIPTDGRFAMHLDFNKHPETRLDNRLVFITYLNKDWRSSYGGQLELWDGNEQDATVKIDPVFGRSVFFAQSSKSIHGHPEPVNAPDNQPRCSVAAYFYTNGREDGADTEEHSTVIKRDIVLRGKMRLWNNIKYCTPPILIDLYRRISDKH